MVESSDNNRPQQVSNRRLRKIFSNRNVIIFMVVLFVLWLSLFDRDNFIRLQSVDKQIETLEEERNFYKDLITADSLVIEGLSDSSFVEQYAREHFLLKRSGETIYIVR